MQGFRWLIVAAALAMVPMPAFALDGDLENGKRVFMLKGQGNKACMSCHPGGETTGKMPNGKKIPNLLEEHLSDKKVKSKTNRFLKRMKLELNDKDRNDLYAFVQALPEKGFGPIPAEWEEYVKTKRAK